MPMGGFDKNSGMQMSGSETSDSDTLTEYPCPNLEVKDLFNGVKDKNKCTECGLFETICYIDVSFLTNQSNEWDKQLLTKFVNNTSTINEKCSVYNDYYNGKTSSNDNKRSNNCKSYLRSLMKDIEGSSPRCIYDNAFKSQNYANCV